MRSDPRFVVPAGMRDTHAPAPSPDVRPDPLPGAGTSPPPLPPPEVGNERTPTPLDAPPTGGQAREGEPSGADGGWRRLHALSPVVGAIETVAGFFVPILLLVLFSRGFGLELLLLFSLVPSTAFAVLRYLAFSYRLGDEEIVVRDGILRKTVRHVPYERIQNLDLSRGLVQRIFGLSQLSLETASGTEPEAVFRWVGEPDVRAIETRVVAVRGRASLDPEPAPLTTVRSAGPAEPGGSGTPGRGSAAGIPHAVPAGTEATLLHQVPTRDLILLGFFSLRGFAVFAAILGLAVQFDIFDDPRTLLWFRSVPERWGDIAAAGIALPLAAGFGLLLLVSLVSIVLTVVENQGFRLSDAGRELRTRFGLLTQRASTIPKGRIQILELISPLHLRPFDRVRIWAGTAGGRAEGTAARSWLVPILRREQVDPLLHAIQPAAVLPDASWQSVHPLAGRRMQRRATFWILVLSGGLTLRFGLPGLLVLLLVPVALLYAARTARHLGYALTEEAVFARHGWLYSRTQIVRLGRIQSASMVESPFDRRWGMARLEVDTASPARGQLHMPYLPVEVATELQRKLSLEASRRRFRW